METVELNKKQTAILQTLAPKLEKIGIRYQALIAFLLAIILVGLYGLYKQIAVGHIVTGMRDHVIWGYYIVNFVYFIGVSYSGALLAAILYYFDFSWGKPVIRMATLMAWITGVIGPVFILLCIGRFDRLHYLFIHARVQSPITWDVLVISTYLVGITIFAYLVLIKDFALFRDTDLIRYPNWRRRLYRWLSIGYRGTPEQEEKIHHLTRSMAFIMIPKVILAFSVLSWIFGMTLRPGWHSTIFGPAFVISSIITGIALIITLMWIFRKLYGLEEYFRNEQFSRLAYLMLVLTAGYAYFTFSEYITVWYSSGKWETEVMNKLFSFEDFGWAFHSANLFGIVLPLIILAFPKFRTPNITTFLSFLLVVAMWVRRYLTVVPTLETPLVPIQDTRPEYLHYQATWVEWSLVLAGIATFIVYFILVSRWISVVPVAEMGKESK